jgi:transcriptional regulator with XRE-family HTH domain
VTNEKIGELIGLSYSAVSRLRRGERLPSIEVMVAIEKHFRWSVSDQVTVRTSQGPLGYARVLNDKIEEHLTTRPGAVT